MKRIAQYIKKFIEYRRSLKFKHQPKLAMAMCVRNEADIIAMNIRFHLAYGVDKFYVMDNYSDDGTYEILKDLSEGFDISLFRERSYSQAKYMTFLTNRAHEDGCDWVIENDADEFWRPLKGDLKMELDFNKSVIKCHRYNVVPTQDSMLSGHPVFYSKYRTNTPILYDWKVGYSLDKDINYILADVGDKVMVNTHGFIDVKFGNHRAKHIASKWPNRKPDVISDGVIVYHFMIRGYDQFKKRLVAMNENFISGQMKSKQGQAWYWNSAYELGETELVYKKMVLNESQISSFVDGGFVIEDLFISEIFENYNR